GEVRLHPRAVLRSERSKCLRAFSLLGTPGTTGASPRSAKSFHSNLRDRQRRKTIGELTASIRYRLCRFVEVNDGQEFPFCNSSGRDDNASSRAALHLSNRGQ